MAFWDFVPALVTAGATLYGTKLSSDANNKAAQQATEASKASVAAQLDANRLAERNLNINRAAASPGLLATNEILSRGSKLTPEQLQGVEDSRRQSLNALKGSSLRGSARTTAATVSDTDKRVRNNFMTSNQNAADTTARALATQYFGAGTALATNDINRGSAISQGLLDQGTVQSSNTIGQGALIGKSIGDVGAVISDTVKNDILGKRDSSYKAVGA